MKAHASPTAEAVATAIVGCLEQQGASAAWSDDEACDGAAVVERLDGRVWVLVARVDEEGVVTWPEAARRAS